MGRDTVQLETAINTISHEYLLDFTSEYGIPETLHPALPGPEDRIVDFPEAKVSHFEINCRVLNVIPTLSLFRVFYTPSFNSGWMSFSKRPGRNTPQCYTKPLDSLKNWNNRFFWVDERVFPTVVDWRTNAPKDGMPAVGTYSIEAVRALDTHRTPIQRQLEMLLCLVGISRRYYLGDELYPTFLHDDVRDMDLFNLIRAPNPTKVKTESRPRAPYEVPLLTLTAPRIIEMDELAAIDSSGVPSTIERSPLDFAHEAEASDQGVAALEMPSSEDVPATAAPGAGHAEETATMDPLAAQESHKIGHDGTDVNAPPKSLRRDHADPRPSGSSHRGKSLAAIQLGLASTVVVPEDTPMGVSDPDPLSFADAPSRHYVDVAQSTAGDPESENDFSSAEVRSPGSVYQPEWGVTNARQVAMGSQLRLRFEQEAKLLRKSVAQVARRDKRIQARELEIRNLEASLEAEWCAEMDARLDALSIDFDEELYPHMLTAIAGRRWVIRHRLRLAVMKCGESLESRQAFADVVSAGIAKGLSEGLRHGLEHGQAQRSLESIEAYDPEAEAKFFAALQALKDLKYPLVDQLKGLRDALMDVIMAALYLESDTGDDASQDICNLHPSSS
nr:transposase (putative), gypsy type [Tanacetum cinerariifolium]